VRITGILGIVMQPGPLLADPSGYIFASLVWYSGGLGSIGGVLIADYWVVRHRKLELADLYLPQGAYRYGGGWSWKAMVATLAGCALVWGRLVIPAAAVVRLRVVRGLCGRVHHLCCDLTLLTKVSQASPSPPPKEAVVSAGR